MRDIGAFSALPDEVVAHVFDVLALVHLPSISRLRKTCHALHARLDVLLSVAEERQRMRWHIVTGGRMRIVNAFRTVHGNGLAVSARPLPTSGRVSWTMLVDSSYNNFGLIRVGVCTDDEEHQRQ